MVATKNEEVFWILDLIGQEEANGLQRLLAPIDIITKEKIVSFRREAAVLEQSEEVIVLAVNISTNLYVRTIY